MRQASRDWIRLQPRPASLLQYHHGIISYTISYVLNGGTNSTSNPTSYNVDSATITLKSPNRTGYTFDGWYSSSSYTSSVAQIAKGSTGNKVFYAKLTPINYSITYVMNGGTNNSANPESYTIETNTITLQNPTKTGSVFEGWYTDASFRQRFYSIAKGSQGSVTLYAKWSAIQYSVTYNLNGGKNNSKNPTYFYYSNSAITLYEPSKTGYYFDYWTDASGNRVTSIPANTASSITLNAHFATRVVRPTQSLPLSVSYSGPLGVAKGTQSAWGYVNYLNTYEDSSNIWLVVNITIKSGSVNSTSVPTWNNCTLKIKYTIKNSSGTTVSTGYVSTSSTLSGGTSSANIDISSLAKGSYTITFDTYLHET